MLKEGFWVSYSDFLKRQGGAKLEVLQYIYIYRAMLTASQTPWPGGGPQHHIGAHTFSRK